MNPHLKLAYEQGVQKALEDATAATVEKLAFRDKEEETAGALLYGLPVELGIGAGGAGLAHHLLHQAGTEKGVTRDQAQKLINTLGLEEQYGSDKSLSGKQRISLEPNKYRRGAIYQPFTGEIFLDKGMRQGSPDMLAHELGHATSDKPGLLNKLRRANFRSFYPGAMLGSLATGGAVLFTDPDSDNPYLIPAAGAAIQAPRVAEEALASVKAMKALRETGDYDESTLRKMRGRLGRAGLGYVLAGLGAALGPVAMRYGQRNYEKD